VPRRKRVFVEGGIYHVYNRTAHGAGVFYEEAAAEGFLEHLRSGIDAGGHRVLANQIGQTQHDHIPPRF
jgi:hypothetical protein